MSWSDDEVMNNECNHCTICTTCTTWRETPLDTSRYHGPLVIIPSMKKHEKNVGRPVATIVQCQIHDKAWRLLLSTFIFSVFLWITYLLYVGNMVTETLSARVTAWIAEQTASKRVTLPIKERFSTFTPDLAGTNLAVRTLAIQKDLSSKLYIILFFLSFI